MKFSIHATDFAQALKAAQSVADARPIRPIYECVRIDADGAGITVTGGTSEQQISTFVEADVKEGGAVAVPMKVLSGYINAMSGDITVASDKAGSISLKSGSLKAAVAGQDVDNYTVLNIDSAPVFTADAARFSDAISSVAFAASTDQTYVKRALCCVHIEVSETGYGEAVTVSDKEFARRRFPVNMLDDSPVEINIPTAFVKPLCSVLQGQEQFSLSVEKHVVMVSTENSTFIFPETDGKYIEWRRIIDSVSSDKFAKADAKGLLDVLRFSFVSGKNGESFLARLFFDSKNQTLSISSRGVTTESKASIGIDYTGEDIDISFDIRVVQDVANFCAASGTDDIEISLSAPMRLAQLRPLDGNDDYLAFITPVRTLV